MQSAKSAKTQLATTIEADTQLVTPNSRIKQSYPSTIFLDGLRGLAAVYVLLHHALLWMHPGYQNGYVKHPAEYSHFSRALFGVFYLFRFGDTAVIFFFVLSGFVIHLRQAKQFVGGQPAKWSNWVPFLFRRAKRLYPPLLAAIIVTYAADRIGIAKGYTIYSGNTPYAVINQNIVTNHQPSTLIGNLLFVMRTYVPVWGTDSPLWSLKFEWWFYLLYPAFWPLINRSIMLVTCVIVLLYLSSISPVDWPIRLLQDVFSAMLIWWFGVLLAEVYVSRIRLSYAHLAWLALLLPFSLFANLIGRSTPNVFWGAGFTGFLSIGFYWQQRGYSLRVLEGLKFLGDCSYTLYVVHAPFVILAAGWLMARSPSGELPSSFIPALSSIFIIPFAYLLHFLVERPFAKNGTRRKKALSP